VFGQTISSPTTTTTTGKEGWLRVCGVRVVRKGVWWCALAVCMMVVPFVLWCVFVVPDINAKLHVAVTVVYCVLWTLHACAFVWCSTSDAGVIPPRRLTKGVGGDDGVSPHLASPFDAPPVLRKVSGATLQYCDTCNVYRPSRASHCSDCDVCVLQFDHHCVWLNNCVGVRNYRVFLIYVNAVVLLVLFTLAISVALLALAQAPLVWPILFALYSLVVGGLVGSLACFHCMLSARAQTTREYVKHYRDPYRSHSWCDNWIRFWCAPAQPSFVEPEMRKCTLWTGR
jgi:palmitoyltransferase ZDHHC9/14/18